MKSYSNAQMCIRDSTYIHLRTDAMDNYDSMDARMKQLAADFGFSEDEYGDNMEYVGANYVDPSMICLLYTSLRPNTSVDFRFFDVVITDNRSTAKVVVLIPPAVEPGEPPIIMSTRMIKRPLSVMAARSIVLNPAVLALTD